MDLKRYLEIGADGIAFHETDFAGQIPPAEVHYCDCAGPGRHTHNPQVHDPFDLDSWKKRHTGPKCNVRRQFFVDVTHRSEAQLGMSYDEKSDTFSEVK